MKNKRGNVELIKTVAKHLGPRLTAISASQVFKRSTQRQSTWPSFDPKTIPRIVDEVGPTNPMISEWGLAMSWSQFAGGNPRGNPTWESPIARLLAGVRGIYLRVAKASGGSTSQAST